MLFMLQRKAFSLGMNNTASVVVLLAMLAAAIKNVLTIVIVDVWRKV